MFTLFYFYVINLFAVYQGQQTELFILAIYVVLLGILMNVLLKLFY